MNLIRGKEIFERLGSAQFFVKANSLVLFSVQIFCADPSCFNIFSIYLECNFHRFKYKPFSSSRSSSPSSSICYYLKMTSLSLCLFVLSFLSETHVRKKGEGNRSPISTRLCVIFQGNVPYYLDLD